MPTTQQKALGCRACRYAALSAQTVTHAPVLTHLTTGLSDCTACCQNNVADGPGNSIAKPFKDADTRDPATSYLCSSVSGNAPPNCR